jgi:hypothetical protein
MLPVSRKPSRSPSPEVPEGPVQVAQRFLGRALRYLDPPRRTVALEAVPEAMQFGTVRHGPVVFEPLLAERQTPLNAKRAVPACFTRRMRWDAVGSSS